jgi:hypothetical protein
MRRTCPTLTWDSSDPIRQWKLFETANLASGKVRDKKTGKKKKMVIDEVERDLREYLASESSGDDGEKEGNDGNENVEMWKLLGLGEGKKRERKRREMREQTKRKRKLRN